MMMEKIIFKKYEEPELENPILVSGLPGIGNVGKITADYFIEKLKMKKMADIFSEYLPPQVLFLTIKYTLLGTQYIIKNREKE